MVYSNQSSMLNFAVACIIYFIYFVLQEECLLEHVLADHHLASCTAIDVWCFIAR